MHDGEQPNSEDPNLVGKLVEELKSQGIFDQIRSDCLGEVDSRVNHRKSNLLKWEISRKILVFSAGLSKS